MEYKISIPDPVHRYIRLTKLEQSIVDLPEFQRLKRIKQLGVASVVFPGALHTRFEHSLGTMHVADLIFDRFADEFNEIDLQKVRLAGLLHDIGHSAFSHTVEIGLNKLQNILKPRYKKHESYTRAIISNFGKKPDLIDALEKSGIKENPNSFFKNISDIATGKKGELQGGDKFLSSIISGEIDADRIDYLIRDGLHTGINFIGFNLQHVLENISKSKDQLILGKQYDNRSFDERVSVTLGESVLISRYHYYSNVVNHPGNVAANLMLIKALEYALINLSKDTRMNLNEKKNELDKFFRKYDDDQLLNFISEKGGKEAAKLVNSLKEGKIICCVSDLKSRALPPKIKLYIELLNQNPQLLNDIEKATNKIIEKQKIYVGTSSVSGVPKNLRIKVCKTERFLYDESGLAASLIQEILSSSSLYFFCCIGDDKKLCKKFIKNNWGNITSIIEIRINENRKSKPYQLEMLLLFFYKFLKIHGDFQVPIIFITKIYEMIENAQKKLQNSFDYKFNEDFGFLYSPELFEDIMRLCSIGLLKVLISEKSRSIYDYGVKDSFELLDYFDKRNHVYYKFEITPDGRMYCEEISEHYSDYINFLAKNIPTFHYGAYIQPFEPSSEENNKFYYSS